MFVDVRYELKSSYEKNDTVFYKEFLVKRLFVKKRNRNKFLSKISRKRTYKTAASLLSPRIKRAQKPSESFNAAFAQKAHLPRWLFKWSKIDDSEPSTIKRNQPTGKKSSRNCRKCIWTGRLRLRFPPSDQKEEAFEDQDIAYRRESSGTIVGSNWPVSAVSRTALFRITQTDIAQAGMARANPSWAEADCHDGGSLNRATRYENPTIFPAFPVAARCAITSFAVKRRTRGKIKSVAPGDVRFRKMILPTSGKFVFQSEFVFF